jgi:hypothetical protein
MATSYEEFAAQHRGEHLTAFNRSCALVGNYAILPAAVALLSGRPKLAAAIFGLGSTVLAVGHVAEGNLARSLTMLTAHPVWAVRADVAVANDTMKGLVRR